MYVPRFSPACASLMGLCLLSGCVISTSPSQRDQQHTALLRWQTCVQQQTEFASDAESSILDEIEYRCDGHKRDVIITFPEHLENQIRTQLTQNTRLFVAQRHVLFATQNQTSNALPVSFK